MGSTAPFALDNRPAGAKPHNAPPGPMDKCACGHKICGMTLGRIESSQGMVVGKTT